MDRHQQGQQNLPFLLDALYCEEVDHWEHEETEEYYTDVEVASFDNKNAVSEPPSLMENDISWNDEELSTLLSKEQENKLFSVLRNNPSSVEARHEAIEWMLKVVAHYSFSALTAVLAVNYLDRFLFSFPSEGEKPWMTQLAAVACLSLAAKVEEIRVPLLLDLQVEQSKYEFEAKTIQRMEIFVLSTLQWKMNPVTPLSFLDFITRILGLKSHLSWKFLRRCECYILAIISDCRFMCYLPSVVATATVLHVVNNIEPGTLLELQGQLFSILGVDKEKVENCSRLVHEVASAVAFYPTNKRKFASLPGSPKGVMDVSFSSDSSNDSWAISAASVSSSPQPLSKKTRAEDQQK